MESRINELRKMVAAERISGDYTDEQMDDLCTLGEDVECLYDMVTDEHDVEMLAVQVERAESFLSRLMDAE